MMKKRFRIRESFLSILPALLVLYFFGGAIQFAGLLSQTASNLLIIPILLFFIVRKITFRTNISELFLLSSLALLLTLGIVNGSGVVAISVYVYYFSCIGLSLYSAKILVDRSHLNTNKVFEIIRIVLAIQIPVLILQIVYADEISAMSRMPLSSWDVASGTFYLKSDSSLAFTALFAACAAFLLKIKNRQSILFLSITIAFLTNSKASQAAAVLVFIFLNWHELVHSKKNGEMVTALAGTVCSFVLLFVYFYFFKEIGDGAFAALEKSYESRFANETASRFAVLGEVLFGEPNFIGRGLLTYHNPINKSWLYFSGHSLFYSLFIDLGIIGVGVFVMGVCAFTIKLVRTKYFGFVFIFLFFIFSFFNFSLSDMSFLFSYFFFIYLISRYHKVSSHKEVFSPCGHLEKPRLPAALGKIGLS